MRRALSILSLICFLVASSANLAGAWDDHKGKHRAKDYWKHQEKIAKEQRKQEERYWKDVEKQRKEAAKRWQDRGGYDYRDQGHTAYLPDYGPPPPDSYHYRHGGYSGEPSWQDPYGAYYPQRREDRPVGVYTPFGFYQETPRPQYDDYGPRLEGEGQIGPYRFEVWR